MVRRVSSRGVGGGHWPGPALTVPHPTPAALYQLLLRALTRLDGYLRRPLEHELAQEPQLQESRRRFLDGDQLTLADCSLLPKLYIMDVSATRGTGVGGASCKALTLRPLPADGMYTLPPSAHTR